MSTPLVASPDGQGLSSLIEETPTPVKPIDYETAKLMSDTCEKGTGDSDLESSVLRLQKQQEENKGAGKGSKGGYHGKDAFVEVICDIKEM